MTGFRISGGLAATVAAFALLAGPASAAIKYEFTALSSFPFGGSDAVDPVPEHIDPDTGDLIPEVPGSPAIPGETFTGAFTLTYNGFILGAPGAGVVVDAADLDSCTATSNVGPATCDHQDFLLTVDNKAIVSFGLHDSFFSGGIFYYFDTAAFTSTGTFDTVLFGGSQQGRLVVTDIGAATGAVPEPAGWALMILGFGGVGAAVRHRRRGFAIA